MFAGTTLSPPEATAFNNLHGSARFLGMDTEVDTSRLRSLDQQYMMNYSRSLLPYISVHLSLTYHDIQTFQTAEANGWQGELMPSGNLNWVNPFFNLGVHARYRQIRDRATVNNTISRSAGIYFKTTFNRRIPQSTVSYDWSHSAINAGLLPSDNEERRFQYAANYSYKHANSYYTYTNQRFDNLSGGISQNLEQHIFRLDYSNNLIKNRLLFAGNYMFNYTHRRQESSQAVMPFIQIPAVIGLYQQDASPTLGPLDTLATLIDGNVEQSTGINLGGTFLHQNIGFDLSLARTLSVIYLYTDRTADPSLAWSVYTSGDNLAWTIQAGGVLSTFNGPLHRYEISFPTTTARYFKVINTTTDEQPEVYVTEIQGYISDQILGLGPDLTRNHRVNASLSYQAHSYWRLSTDAVFGSQVEDLSGQQRRDANVSGTVSFRPNDKFSSVGRYQRGLTDYRTGLVTSLETELYSLIFLLNPLKTLETSLSGSRLRSWQNQDQTQLTHSALFHLSAVLIPGLNILTETGFSRSERPTTSSTLVTDSWTYRLSADATPYQNLNLISTVTRRVYMSNYLYPDGHRDEADLRFNYRMTPALFLRGGITYGQEEGNESLTQDYSVGWDLTRKISTSANLRFQTNTGSLGSNYSTRILNMQLSYLISDRVSSFAGYSHNKITNGLTEENSSYQVGLNASF
jgi:hypothetical protein